MKVRMFALTVMAALLLASSAFAEETSFDASITLAQPFTIDSTTAAAFDTIYSTGAAMTITMDASPIAAATGDDAAGAAPTVTTATIDTGSGAPTALTGTQTPGIIYIVATQAGVDIDVTLVGTPTLTKSYSAAPTPIEVSGITTNKANFNAQSATALAAGKFSALCVGPILNIPANAETGAYSGSVTVNVTAI